MDLTNPRYVCERVALHVCMSLNRGIPWGR
jgi:hypothetical protein